MLDGQRSFAHARSGFTLIEILIVVVLLGILASMAVGAFGSASRDARESVLRDELRFMRTQLSLYRASHTSPAGLDPVSGSASSSVLVDQLTKFTDYYGNVATIRDGVHSFGPYLSRSPANPFMADNPTDIKVVSGSTDLGTAVDETTGWIYCPETLEFCANSTVYGPNGKKW